jgi:hypothetical protein
MSAAAAKLVVEDVSMNFATPDGVCHASIMSASRCRTALS